MRSRTHAVAVLSLLSLLPAASAAPASDEAAVIARVNAYFHALGTADTAALRASVLRRDHGAWRIAFMHSTRMSSPPAAGLADWRTMGPSGMQMMHLVGTDSPTEMAAFRVHYPAGFKGRHG
jgi:hypothetical protein